MIMGHILAPFFCCCCCFSRQFLCHPAFRYSLINALWTSIMHFFPEFPQLFLILFNSLLKEFYLFIPDSFDEILQTSLNLSGCFTRMPIVPYNTLIVRIVEPHYAKVQEDFWGQVVYLSLNRRTIEVDVPASNVIIFEPQISGSFYTIIVNLSYTNCSMLGPIEHD